LLPEKDALPRVRLICTFTPGGINQFFRDRIELDKTVKRGDPQFRLARDYHCIDPSGPNDVLGYLRERLLTGFR
jgi:hypothetical protein